MSDRIATDAVEAAEAPLIVSTGQSRLVIWMWRVLLIVALGLGWQYASGIVGPFWISNPAAVAQQLWQWVATGLLWIHVGYTLTATVASFFIGSAIGIVLGVIFGLNRRVAAVLDPFLGAIYSLPKVALAPLFILWFGIGIESKIVLASVGVFFLVFYNTYSGTLSVDRELVDVLRLMGASRQQIIRKIILPSAMLWIFTGMKVSVPYAMIGVIVGEMMASNRGLGYLIQSSAGQYDTGGVFAALFVLMIISVSMQAAVKRAEKSMMHWASSHQAGH